MANDDHVAICSRSVWTPGTSGVTKTQISVRTLSGADFRGADLGGRELTRANLGGANLTRASLGRPYGRTLHASSEEMMDYLIGVWMTFWRWTTHDAVAAYTAVLAISTIGLWIVTALGIRNQRRNTEILQRAYLSVEPGGIQQPYDRVDRVQGYVICRNRGHLPARKLSWHTRTDTVQQGAEPFPLGEMSEPRGVVAPGTEMILHAMVRVARCTAANAALGAAKITSGCDAASSAA